MEKTRKKQVKKYIAWGCLVLLVLLLAVMPLLATPSAETDGPRASILSARAETADIQIQLLGGGTLASSSSEALTIPAEVKLTEYLVGNGDTVLAGDPIAKVDRVSVMTAIAQVQEALETLEADIESASYDTMDSYISAQAGGTVKVLYAQEGEDVQEVMLEHGALAVLSLDDKMAVRIARSTGLAAGDKVCVTLADGTEADGTVESNLEGVLTVTLADEGYGIGQSVTVTTEDGSRIGTGELYIHSSWSAVGYSGTVSRVWVAEDQTIYAGQTLMQLKDTGKTASYQKLVNQHREYEELLLELMTMYQTETLTAPCDGIVSGVDKDGAFLLAAEAGGWTVTNLTQTAPETGFIGLAGRVETVEDRGMTLLVDTGIHALEDLKNLSAVPCNVSGLTQSWSYTGSVKVYTQWPDGTLHEADSVQPGDCLLAVGDAEELYWFIKLEAAETVQAKTGIHLLSDTITLTASANTGTVNTQFSAVLRAMQGENTVAGTWGVNYEVTPNWLTIEEGTSVLGGLPTAAGEYPVSLFFTPEGEGAVPQELSFKIIISAPDQPACTYTAAAAKVIGVVDGTVQVKQSTQTQTVTDLTELPTVVPNEADMTVEAVYAGSMITTEQISVGDILLLVYDSDGNLQTYQNLSSASGEKPGGSTQLPGQSGGMPDLEGIEGIGSLEDLAGLAGLGGFGSGGASAGGMTGFGGVMEEEEELYSTETVTIATITSQEKITVDFAVDELDISKIYVGQEAVLTVDALGGRSFSAVITKIANSGENSGGSTKFTVTAEAEKDTSMYPGMTGSISIPLQTVEDVLCIPLAALVEDGGKTLVYTGYDAETDTLLEPVEVTTGVSDGEKVQILTGLEPEDQIWYAYYDTLEISFTPESGFSFGR